ncbi:hypothetical protein HPB51_014218 [Rhipicephalus microplus]|uniref:JAB1/MPN/MOV34 metalloenzyme domain-containing protein n=1 Tax=Rhipicephalus microplus TaxID=6941 RepID=A0A9J6E125_RHIMP|nr:hypothetical protein HPB51_014218 [Rhipicephalus microplus]
MSTVRVNLSADVYMVCLSHALSTEKEEVMGLLIGEVSAKEFRIACQSRIHAWSLTSLVAVGRQIAQIDEMKVAHISAVILLRRSDKRKDRVEISPEQLSDASTQAEVCVPAALSCDKVPYA